MKSQGHLRKMAVELNSPVNYALPLDDALIPLNAHIGAALSLRYSGEIHCIHCGRLTRKSYSQGHCYPCMQKLASCDMCIVKPELCHFQAGTCREPQWGETHCMQDHYVYLANSSGIKVGITRGSQVPTRWIDQGASQALPIFRVRDRHTSGLVEVILKHHVADRTDWRRMLRGEPDGLDLAMQRDELMERSSAELDALEAQLGRDAIQFLDNETMVNIDYPVMAYPKKITALNLDRTPDIDTTLLGIKGQYLVTEHGVLNIRKYAGYRVEVTLG